MVSLVSCIVISHSLTFSNSDLSISLNMNFIFLQWIQICNRILCRLILLQSGYRLSNVERFILIQLIQRKSLLISFIHKKIIYFQFLVQEQYPVLKVLLPYKITLLSNGFASSHMMSSVLLPYRITLLSNLVCVALLFTFVLLPYKITLLSNAVIRSCTDFQVLLPYKITLLSNCRLRFCVGALFYYPIKLHYSQTILLPFCNISWFYYPIKLHYSQTL